ncbi:hypothetical protein LH407_01305 [Antiquaquibacter oligotrophicus]|nr:hypothetical protein [Antiquaquibacter oligotrophicus]UDF14751.1 hypothetical protein LH407_01305 [Antiquaquibacter oligotrophicus]
MDYIAIEMVSQHIPNKSLEDVRIDVPQIRSVTGEFLTQDDQGDVDVTYLEPLQATL